MQALDNAISALFGDPCALLLLCFLFAFEKTLALIYSKLHSKYCDYFYTKYGRNFVVYCLASEK